MTTSSIPIRLHPEKNAIESAKITNIEDIFLIILLFLLIFLQKTDIM